MYDSNTTVRCKRTSDAESASSDFDKRYGQILAVDCDPAVIQIYRTVLTRAFDVQIASTGKVALEHACHAKAIDLVVLDYKLPDMCGLEVLRRLKKTIPSVPVIFVTGFRDEDVAIKAFRLGARDYIKKPFNIVEMHKRIEFYLKLREKAGDSRKSISFDDHHPNNGYQPPAATANDYKIQQAKIFIDDNYMEKISRSIVAQKACMSQYHFSREFRKITGLTFQDYLNKSRIEKAKELFSKNRATVTEAAFSVGYSDLTNLERIFKKVTGFLPSHYKKIAEQTLKHEKPNRKAQSAEPK
jgi:YesN/AraC family two-component response regulator